MYLPPRRGSDGHVEQHRNQDKLGSIALLSNEFWVAPEKTDTNQLGSSELPFTTISPSS